MKQKIPPILIDLDGVLRAGNSILPGAEDFLIYIADQGINALVLSNTTQSSAVQIRTFFTERNIDIPIPILTAADAALHYVRENYSRAAVYALPAVTKLFEDLLDYNSPEVVVMGDMGKEWDFEKLNEIFNYVHKGMPLIAMQKNRFWKTPEEGLLLDLGAFVASIEYAASVKSLLIGKPSELYFTTALKKLGVNPGEKFLMVGDDLENDIYPVQKLNGKGILLFTGKTAFPLKEELKMKPDYQAMNLHEVIQILENY